MDTSLECIPCFLNQALGAAKRCALSSEETESLLREMLTFLSTHEWQMPPPVLGRKVHRLVRQRTGNDDPYLTQKTADTALALGLLPEIEAAVVSSTAPFTTALQYAVAGNAIDFGATNGWDASVCRTFQEALSMSLDTAAVARLERAIAAAKTILFLTDNCGEIVFDRPLLSAIGADKLTIAVRGGPVLNDATMADASGSGLTDRYRVVSNGSDVPGTWLPDCARDFKVLFENVDLVISKGQGNYECLNAVPREICFLFMVKCPFIAKRIGMPTGSHAICFSKTNT